MVEVAEAGTTGRNVGQTDSEAAAGVGEAKGKAVALA
jgi:hypothetical protein